MVIGAGMGGLAAAARLAAQGHHVTVIERSAHTGGKLHAARHEGFVFDTGPSLLTLPAVYRDLFIKTGTPLEQCLDLVPVDPAFGYHFPDGSSVVLPGAGTAAAADAMQQSFGGQTGAQWQRLMERAGHMWSITRGPFLQSARPNWRTMASLATSVSDVRTIAPTSTLRDIGKQYLTDNRARQILDRYATYTGSDPRQAPAVLATIAYVEQTFGAWHISGGLSTLGQVLTQRCQELEVAFELNCAATAIDVAGDQVRAVTTADGRRFVADIVVSNTDATVLYDQLLPPGIAGKERRALTKAQPSLAGFVVLLGLAGRTPGLQHHNVWFPEHYDAEFDSIFARVPEPVIDPAIYVCAPDDATMRPDDHHESWFVLVNAPRHGDGRSGTMDWQAPGIAAHYAQHVVDLLAARGTDIRDRIVWQHHLSPADLQERTLAPGGSIYGWSSNGARAAFRRPANQSAIRGLFLVGGSAHPGGGLPLVAMGAETVAGLIH